MDIMVYVKTTAQEFLRLSSFQLAQEGGRNCDMAQSNTDVPQPSGNAIQWDLHNQIPATLRNHDFV